VIKTPDGPGAATRINAALRNLLTDGDTGTRRGGATAAQTGEICGACGRSLALRRRSGAAALRGDKSRVGKMHAPDGAGMCGVPTPDSLGHDPHPTLVSGRKYL